ncbi:acetylxylan esterase [uncultured Thiodictyon sp.]|uniref:acetylxylan esterase n=1 Tax=uncultured Thiodictyon sp. TaxID=1846217 RepID=UPI0025F2BE94|nr:acetylxylan esterase [uncultured Thiodictyon sp.]
MHLTHGFPFDPSYGYRLEDLLELQPPPEPADFATFWQARYQRALAVDANPRLRPADVSDPRMRVHELEYSSTAGFAIRGWLLTPLGGPPRRGFILGHGYGGLDRPPLDLPRDDAAYLIPCVRGLCRSRCPPIPEDPDGHVVYGIEHRDSYLVGGCVEDLWTGASALLGLFPELTGHLGYLGTSLGGGLGALALAWDARIGRGHLNVPGFGHQPLRLALPTVGSAAALQRLAQTRAQGPLLDTLAYFDSALAARHIRQPMLVAAAGFDPAVAPPGQFAVYNAIPGDKRLCLLTAGHFDYPGRRAEEQRLMAQLWAFFAPL